MYNVWIAYWIAYIGSLFWPFKIFSTLLFFFQKNTYNLNECIFFCSQVLKGDLKPAVEIHEMLYQVMQRHNFLPEAFTTDFRVHWAQHPLRPEFIESTYFLYRVGQNICK